MCGKTEKWSASKKQTRDSYRTCERDLIKLFCYLFTECLFFLLFNKTKRKEKTQKNKKTIQFEDFQGDYMIIESEIHVNHLSPITETKTL